MPSGVVKNELFKIARNAGFFCASLTPCTPVTQTYPFCFCSNAFVTASTAESKLIALNPTPKTLTRGGRFGEVSVDMVAYNYGVDYAEKQADNQLTHGMKLLVFAHTPPPHHGQSYMVQLMLEGFGGDRRKRGKGNNRAANSPSTPSSYDIECYHVNARLSSKLEDIGNLR